MCILFANIYYVQYILVVWLLGGHHMHNFNLTYTYVLVYKNQIIYNIDFFPIFDRCERRRQPDHRVIIRTGVHAEPVQLVHAGQPPRRRRWWHWRWWRRRTPSDAAYESYSNQPSAHTHTNRLHGGPDEPHVGCLLSTPANTSTFLHMVLTHEINIKSCFPFYWISMFLKLSFPLQENRSQFIESRTFFPHHLVPAKLDHLVPKNEQTFIKKKIMAFIQIGCMFKKKI